MNTSQNDSIIQEQNKKKNSYKLNDKELESVLSAHKTVIKVLGCGGAGNNTLTRLSEVGVKEIETIAVNTDAQDLLYTKADSKILIGRNITNGLGAGSNPIIGEDSARESQEEIRDYLENSDMVFITCGLGGGTGTGSAPVIAEIAKEIGALTIAVVTLPFTEEGILRWDNATQGLEKLRINADTVIVVQNDRLLDIVPDLPLNAAFKIADEILVNAVKGITELVTEKGLVNLDFADVKSIMKDGDTAMIGIGESNSENKAMDAVDKAVTNPLLDVDITGAKSALINVTGDENMTIRDARGVMLAIAEKLDPEAKIIWGACIDENLKGFIRVLLIATGLKSSERNSKKSISKNTKFDQPKKEKQKLFDIAEPTAVKIPTTTLAVEDLEEKEEKKAKRVFTEIFEEEIRGDINIFKEAVNQLHIKKDNEKPLSNILKACTSIQSSAQLFAYEKIEEFSVFIAEVIEGLIAGDVMISDKLIKLLITIPAIVDGMIANNKVALPEAQDLIQNLTKIIDNSNPNKRKTQSKDGKKDLIDDDLIINRDNIGSKLGMELN